MAQTKRKRRSKHRGNAAGVVEARGRTSRPVPAADRKKEARAAARETRLNTPPTWQGAIRRAAIAAAVMFVVLLTIGAGKGGNRLAGAALFAVVALVVYVPMGYYLDRFLYDRRQRMRARARAPRD